MDQTSTKLLKKVRNEWKMFEIAKKKFVMMTEKKFEIAKYSSKWLKKGWIGKQSLNWLKKVQNYRMCHGLRLINRDDYFFKFKFLIVFT